MIIYGSYYPPYLPRAPEAAGPKWVETTLSTSNSPTMAHQTHTLHNEEARVRKVLGCEDDDKFKSERVRAKGGNEVVKWSFFLTQEKRNELIAGIVLFKDSKNEVKCDAVDPLLNNKWFNKITSVLNERAKVIALGAAKAKAAAEGAKLSARLAEFASLEAIEREKQQKIKAVGTVEGEALVNLDLQMQHWSQQLTTLKRGADDQAGQFIQQQLSGSSIMETEIKAQTQRNIGKVDDEYADLAKAWTEIAFWKKMCEP